ncbi:MAG: response regulator [Simkaniaceae bacterium]|nr:MAG: response regulator [Simkaniaceae bacterium]
MSHSINLTPLGGHVLHASEEKTFSQGLQQTIRVLHVEDTEFIRSATGDIIKDLKGVYTGASTGEEAFRIYTPDGFDIVIMDMELGPGINGYETARRIRQINPHQLIYSCSSKQVHESEALFSGNIPKEGIRRFLQEKISQGQGNKKSQ